MVKNNKNEQKVVELHIDNSMKNVWVDNIHMAVREDDVCVIRLSTNLPEGLFEQLRFITNKSRLKEFVDIICSTISYHPSQVADQDAEQSNSDRPASPAAF